MSLTTEQRLHRLQVRTDELAFWRDRAYVSLDGWSFNGEPLALGAPWPRLEGVSYFEHPEVQVPEEWPVDEARLDLDLGGEGLIVIAYEGGGKESFGLDPYHGRYPLEGAAFSVSCEAVARLPLGVPNRSARLARAAITWPDAALERLERALLLLREAARVLGPGEIVPSLLDCAERAFASIEWPTDTPEYLARSAQSREMLEIWEPPPDLEAHPAGLADDQRTALTRAADRLDADLEALRLRYPEVGEVALTGHAHLDLAWLWPLDETRRKARRTYHTAVALMDRYPEFVFNQSTAQAYEYVREDDPELFERIRAKTAAGQWEPIGGMWVEPDLNLPAGESLVRQLLYGQRFFERHFGHRHTVAWLPDCFGFTGALPQLLAQSGIDDFFTHKMNWAETNKFPHDLFWWEGIDGSRVLGHQFWNPLSGYNGDPGPSVTVPTWRNYRGKTHYPETLLAIGYGDGGGGTTEEMLEKVRALGVFPALPKLRFTKVSEFYSSARRAIADKDVPIWVGELYLESHRGTYTTQGRTKYLHRRAERDLVTAEVTAGLNLLLGGDTPESLEDLWRVVLRNEFHDILPGSSIREVYVDAEQELSGVVEAAGASIEASLEALGDRIIEPGKRPAVLAVNPDLSARPLRIEAAYELPGGQAVEGGHVLATPTSVPALGAAVVIEPGVSGALEVAPGHIENNLLRVELASDGALKSVFDKLCGREVLADRGNQLWAYVDKPRAFDAWEIDADYVQQGIEMSDLESADVIESGPHRASVRIRRRFRNSTVTQELRLWSNSARLEIKTTLDWHDRHWLLKARFPLAVRSERATFETAFGVVERPTHRNTSWDAAKFEVPAHRFVDLSEPGYGVALLNDGKYGHHALHNEIGITLLRSPTYPDPLADEGTQTFTYALYPHAGGWFEGGVLMEAEDLNRPLPARPVFAGPESSLQVLGVEGLSLGLGALKVCEDSDDLVLRVYEPQGARGRAEITAPEGWALDSELNLLEDPIGGPDPAMAPFQVRSWRLTRRPSEPSG